MSDIGKILFEESWRIKTNHFSKKSNFGCLQDYILIEKRESLSALIDE